MLPNSKPAMTDFVIAAVFFGLGVLLPGALLDTGFQAHVGGIAVGAGIGWLVRSLLFYGVNRKEKQHA